MTKHLITVTALACALASGVVGVAVGQDNAADTARLIEVLQLKPGSIVAEVGAGDGDLTIALAKHVGPDGRVFTSELGAERITRLRAAVTKSEVTNVQVVEGQDAHANLPDGCCDAIFMRNVYHHFGDPRSMNASFLKALKPAGRVSVIDFLPPPGTAVAEPGKRGEDGHHGVSAEVVSAELKAAGFQIISATDQPVAPGTKRVAASQRWFVVVAAKP